MKEEEVPLEVSSTAMCNVIQIDWKEKSWSILGYIKMKNVLYSSIRSVKIRIENTRVLPVIFERKLKKNSQKNNRVSNEQITTLRENLSTKERQFISIESLATKISSKIFVFKLCAYN